MRLYNSLTKEKEKFEPINPPKVKMYVCGPTVYGPDHLGHARVGVFYDCLRRYMDYQGYKVEMVQNITDVGHLTDDADQGEDKIEKKAKEEDKTPAQIAQYYTKRHFNDMAKLNVLRPDHSPKASEYISEMIEVVEKLIEKGYAYEKLGNVYFSVEKFKDYGKLSNRKLDELLDSVRVEEDENKKYPLDFALWLKADKSHIQKWDSPWGKGYPGWHLECSVMNLNILGETIDIHGGASELVFPHHENEIAQSEALTGKKFVNYWVHIGLVLAGGKKMSKSKGNFLTIRKLLKKHSSDEIRLALLSTYYSKPFNYSKSRLKKASRIIAQLTRIKTRLKRKREKEKRGENKDENKKRRGVMGEEKGEKIVRREKKDRKLRKKFEDIMDDNVNTPRLISFWMEEGENMSLNLFNQIAGVLGVEIEDTRVPEKIKEMVDKRERFREDGNFSRADKIRNQIEDSGYILEDTKEGTKVWPK